MNKIPWWHTEIGDAEKANVLLAFDKKRFSMGEISSELERKLAEALHIPYVVLTNSGTSALTMALLAIGLVPDNEVIVPALTWIATAQAPALLGAKVVLADCLHDVPIIDLQEVKKKVTKKTKVIISVHLNGRACDVKELTDLAQDANAFLIEDACKSMFSKYNGGYLGTFGEAGCFSMGMISILSVGYGGFVVTRDEETYNKLCLIRDHGVVRQPEEYRFLGSNFKISDLLASIGIAQLDRLEEKLEHVRAIYTRYVEGLSLLGNMRVLPVDISSGKIPLYTEAYSEYREEIINFLKKNDIEVSRFHLPLQQAKYLGNYGEYPNALNFAKKCFILPSGTSQPTENVDRCIQLLRDFNVRAQ